MEPSETARGFQNFPRASRTCGNMEPSDISYGSNQGPTNLLLLLPHTQNGFPNIFPNVGSCQHRQPIYYFYYLTLKMVFLVYFPMWIAVNIVNRSKLKMLGPPFP